MIIFINGSINSGKSTVAKILANKIGKTAVLEIDSLRQFIDWLPIDSAIPLNLKNAVSVIKNFVESGLNVVVPYPLSESNYVFFRKELDDLAQDITVFTLNPGLEVALKNRGSRELNDWEQERIKYHYEIGLPNPSFGSILDNSQESPEQSAEKIFQATKTRP